MGTVPRFFVSTPLDRGEVILPPHVAHQVTAVLRLRPGDPLVLFDGSGGEWESELVAGPGQGQRGPREVVARTHRLVEPRREPALRLTLCQAMLKADKFEWVLQKGTELGVAVFQPLVTQRTVPLVRAKDERSMDTPRDDSKLARWRRIVVEAAEQSGRCAIPRVEAWCSLKQLLQQQGRGAPPTIVCWESETLPFRDALARALPAGSGELRVLIGPEGGFAAEEAAAARAAGAVLASLGPRILRSETAALAAAALTLLDHGPLGVDLASDRRGDDQQRARG